MTTPAPPADTATAAAADTRPRQTRDTWYHITDALTELTTLRRQLRESAEALEAGAGHLRADARGLLYGDVSPFDRPERNKRAEKLKAHATQLRSLLSSVADKEQVK